jgi:cholinesterase
MQKDVVLVSFNYRVGAIGFLSLDDQSLKVPGNAGLKDQVLALKWIRWNISAFGGNANDITLFGTSAGGASVHYLLLSDQSKGLFHRAMAMSGTSLNTSWAFHYRRNYALRIAKQMGYSGSEDDKSVLKFLEASDVSQVVIASEKIVTDEVKLLFLIYF